MINLSEFLKKICEFLKGFAILLLFYFVSVLIIKITHIPMPPAILGLVFFAVCLIEGIIKEDWVKYACEVLMKNMAMFLVPFIGGLIIYKSILAKNWFVILLVIFLITGLTIVITGLFVEYGLKISRLISMRKQK